MPFGEYVPPPFGFVNKITTEAGDFEPGTEMVVFPTDGHKSACFICYESVFRTTCGSSLRRVRTAGKLSNDGYFGHSSAREQHLKIARMRAVENRRWLIRATNDGITAAIDPAGRITERLEPYTATSARMHYSYEASLSPYTRWGTGLPGAVLRWAGAGGAEPGPILPRLAPSRIPTNSTITTDYFSYTRIRV